MSTELLIISEAAEFSSSLGIALTQRGAWRVSLASDVDAALRSQPRGLVLLDSAEKEAGPALARQLHEFGTDAAVFCSPRDEGVTAALMLLEPASDSLAETPLEPLAGDESDAGNWRYVSEPDFLRGYAPDGHVAASVVSDEAMPRETVVAGDAAADPAPATSGEVAAEIDASGPDLDGLVLQTAARFALLRGPGETVRRAGEIDEETEARLLAPGEGEGSGQPGEQLFLVDAGEAQECLLLYVCNAGPRQLSVLVPDDSSVRALRSACDRFLRELD